MSTTTKRSMIAAALIAALVSEGPVCTQRQAWQDLRPGDTVTLDCEGESAPTVCATIWHHDASGKPDFAIGRDHCRPEG